MRELVESLELHVGKTITLFTSSGGISGAGFTGVLACVSGGVVRLITAIGAAPTCPVGSNCLGDWNFNNCYSGGNDGGFGGGFGGGWGGGFGGGWGGGFGDGFGDGYFNYCGFQGGSNYGHSGLTNWLGAVAEIPLDKIVSFTHNALT